MGHFKLKTKIVWVIGNSCGQHYVDKQCSYQAAVIVLPVEFDHKQEGLGRLC